MNANELADAMETRASIRRKATSRKSVQENANDRLADQLEQAATMLRQQQAEIEALKQIIDANNLSQNIGQFVKPTNEPVAWMDDLSFFTEQPDDMDGVTPLYTHPVSKAKDRFSNYESICLQCGTTIYKPFKELTDEEIRHIQAICHLKDVGYDNFIMRFARAILRKAQEK